MRHSIAALMIFGAHERRITPQRVLGIVVGVLFSLTPSAGVAADLSAGCGVDPVIAVNQGSAFGMSLFYINGTGVRVGFHARHNTNIFFGDEGRFGGASVGAGVGARQELTISTIGMPVGIDFVTITITSGGKEVGSCTFSLEVRPVGADPWSEASGPLTETNRIVVPIKWCAVKGSRLASQEFGWLDRALWARSGAASTIYLRAGTGIDFRSAMMSITNSTASFPVIDDPRPPSAGGPGVEGDIEIPAFVFDDVPEMRDAFAACATAWDRLEQRWRVNIEGILALNVHGIVYGGGLGANGLGLHGVPGTQACTQPASVVSNDGRLLVTDSEITGHLGFPPSDPHDKLLGHELGHVLFLGHGNGIDDDNDGLVDQFCDSGENVLATPFSLMSVSNATDIKTEVITTAQRATARPVASVTRGAQRFNSPGVSDVIGDDRVDTVGDVQDPSIDLAHVGIVRNSLQKVVLVSYGLHGLLPNGATGFADRQFLTFLDTDGNPATGGAPASLGYATAFAGAELVTVLTVAQAGSGRNVSGRVWRFSRGAFSELNDAGIDASIQTAMATTDSASLPISDTVVLTMPDAVGTWSSSLRFQAIAADVGNAISDQLPDNPTSESTLILAPPRFPECSVAPLQPHPGEAVTLTVTGLVPNQRVAAFRGEMAAATTFTDAAGTAILSFTLPATTASGTHKLTVGVIGSALTAECRLAATLPDLTPPVLTVPNTLVSDGTSPVGVVVTYSLSVADDFDPNPAVSCNPASGSLFPIGATTVNCTATDASGNSASASFAVVVKGAIPQVKDLRSLVDSWNLGRLGTSLGDKLATVRRFLVQNKLRRACKNLSRFLRKVNSQAGKALTTTQAMDLINRARRIKNVIGC